MAKLSAFPSRAAALEEDGQMDGAFRPDGPPVPRPKRRGPRVDESFGEPANPDPADPDYPEEVGSLPRPRRRITVRRGFTPTVLGQGRRRRIVLAVIVLAILGVVTAALLGVRHFLMTDPRFLIDSSSSIRIEGNSEVTRQELLSVFGSDIGRNIFFVPLAERRAALEDLPWVEHAAVMRLLPDQLRVAITERTPVAFVRLGNRIGLVDAHGVILTMPPAMLSAMHYSFPVVTGISPKDPTPVRAARMKIYQQFISALNSGGQRLSEQLSEVDLSDPEDIRALVPAGGSDILLHFGDEDYLARFRSYQVHLAEWRRQYPRLTAVDLRYERQVVLKMADDASTGPNPSASTGTKPVLGHHHSARHRALKRRP